MESGSNNGGEQRAVESGSNNGREQRAVESGSNNDESREQWRVAVTMVRAESSGEWQQQW